MFVNEYVIVQRRIIINCNVGSIILQNWILLEKYNIYIVQVKALTLIK